MENITSCLYVRLFWKITSNEICNKFQNNGVFSLLSLRKQFILLVEKNWKTLKIIFVLKGFCMPAKRKSVNFQNIYT